LAVHPIKTGFTRKRRTTARVGLEAQLSLPWFLTKSTAIFGHRIIWAQQSTSTKYDQYLIRPLIRPRKGTIWQMCGQQIANRRM
jgi:hypothetical protein